MIHFDGGEVAKEFQEAFGRPIETLNIRELWWIVKICKHVRGRCRNNAAYNNYMNRVVPHATFSVVQKTREDGSTYPGLEIRIKDENS